MARAFLIYSSHRSYFDGSTASPRRTNFRFKLFLNGNDAPWLVGGLFHSDFWRMFIRSQDV